MPLLTSAALAMWWDIEGVPSAEFEHWHSSEHLPERLAVPGFLRGTRWSALPGTTGYFVMYEIEGQHTLAADAYRARVENPTPWTAQMMARFRRMTRSPCHVRGSCGAGLGPALLTLRLSPRAGAAATLTQWICDELLPALAARTGVVGAHFLEAVAALPQPQTAEQKMRGGDANADRVVLVNGFDADGVAALTRGVLDDAALAAHGAAPGRIAGLYRLDHVLMHPDLGTSTAR